MREIVIALTDPAEPSVRALIEALDAYMMPMYPAESNHLLDIETLRQPQMRFFSATANDIVMGCGGCWLHADYAEIKRVYVSPEARGLECDPLRKLLKMRRFMSVVRRINTVVTLAYARFRICRLLTTPADASTLSP